MMITVGTSVSESFTPVQCWTKKNETHTYSIDELNEIPSVIHDFLFFAEEKWKIASDKGGSGNTANIGSIHNIQDILKW